MKRHIRRWVCGCVFLIALFLVGSGFPQDRKLLLGSGGTPVSGGGGSSDFVTETFTDTDGVQLESHTGETGATWTRHPAAAYSGNSLLFASNRVYENSVVAYYASGSPPSADYYVQADITAVSVIAVNIGVAARMDTTADTMYIVRLNNGTSWDLRKIVAGTATTLGTSANQLPTAGQTKTVKLTVSGINLTVTINGVDEITTTDSAISAAGKAGLRGSGAASSTTGFHIDNFSAR